MENYIFDLLERLGTKNTFLSKTQKKEKKEWKLLISLYIKNVIHSAVMEKDQSKK